MNLRLPLVIIGSSVIIVAGSFTSLNKNNWTTDTSVSNVLLDLGDKKPSYFIESPTPEAIERGRQLIEEGRSTGPNGESPGYISRFYVCSSCHNSVREDPNLTKVDQDGRLNYAEEKGIPYLQSSTFWGIVNRESWYNDDYVLKYGDLVSKANKSLEESIQLCATVCSQGRSLKDWEMNAVLSYFWSLQLKLSDLDFTKEEWNQIQQVNADQHLNSNLIAMIKSKYLLKSPATFSDPPADKLKGYGLIGRPDKGEAIFTLSCQHCHRPKGESDVVFDDSKATYKWLKRHMLDNDQKSIYEIIRHGTYSELGHKEYMPNYSLEKMSDQQIEDLRSFIELKVKN